MASSPLYFATVLRASRIPRAARISTIFWSDSPAPAIPRLLLR